MLGKEKLTNTFKIAFAAIISIFIAIRLGLNHAVSAGIVSILTIQPTKKETIKTAVGRFYAFICALFIAFFCFEIVGYRFTAFAIFLIVYIFLCQMLNWSNAMSVNAVLVSHILQAENMTVRTVTNECLIFLIGVGIGIIANMHLRKNVNYIEELKEATDRQIKEILYRMSQRILDKDISDYNMESFVGLKKSIRKAKNVAEENYNNQFKNADTFDIDYIKMRDRQCHVLYEMYKNIRNLHTTPITAKKISKFLAEMAESYHKSNTGKELLVKFRQMDESMKSKPLPIERIEFEDRAKLFTLLRYIEEFIEIKVDFSEKYSELIKSYYND